MLRGEHSQPTMTDIKSELSDRYMSWQLQRKLGALVRLPGDVLDRLAGRQSGMQPPRYKSYAYCDHFTEIGNEFLRHFVELGGLAPDDSVLDIGCGIGRMAIPLTRLLSPRGEYWGFDIVDDGIDWCRRNISRQFANFHFDLVDVHNGSYRRQGQQRASAFRFPYADGFFDFAFACSVFTHMFESDIQNYLSQIARVLKPGGKCLATFFLLNSDSRALVQSGASLIKFVDTGSGFQTASRHEPERALAFDEATIRQAYEQAGLLVVEPIHFGTWCGRTSGRSGQDIVVAARPPGEARGATPGELPLTTKDR
jgi:ubiquinone/menaquinone biosynthesis C-methylase UbiE